jgi:hypothetical protein
VGKPADDPDGLAAADGGGNGSDAIMGKFLSAYPSTPYGVFHRFSTAFPQVI